jgi:hypothetical protein
MPTITKGFRFVFAFVLVLSALGFSTSAALAAPPLKNDYVVTQNVVTSDICSFPITIDATYTFTNIVFLDNTGAFLREFDHVIEVDVFSANGKTLTSLPYTYNLEWLVDSSGNLIHEYGSGGAFRVRLPDGTLVTAAGRMDAFAHPGATYYFPDMGHVSDLTGFCAALAP